MFSLQDFGFEPSLVLWKVVHVDRTQSEGKNILGVRMWKHSASRGYLKLKKEIMQESSTKTEHLQEQKDAALKEKQYWAVYWIFLSHQFFHDIPSFSIPLLKGSFQLKRICREEKLTTSHYKPLKRIQVSWEMLSPSFRFQKERYSSWLWGAHHTNAGGVRYGLFDPGSYSHCSKIWSPSACDYSDYLCPSIGAGSLCEDLDTRPQLFAQSYRTIAVNIGWHCPWLWLWPLELTSLTFSRFLGDHGERKDLRDLSRKGWGKKEVQPHGVLGLTPESLEFGELCDSRSPISHLVI